ncbi:helix-turn-helix domain-containing protein [Burkholderia gladioli]|uniref:helix-turn-helix domain-containing protein n=1 Tax=Burkholderia gladioli TaxID=28095 RepID=UPI0028568894|nr:helix-turn-helix transcriptional regulator [Burkholderia gladioli]MDR8093255.1 helix-turn-helix domain-containing protein [Burkholderia gladioli]
MTTPTINHDNLGRQILAARAVANLTRVELAKLVSLAHQTLKQAEEGDPTVPDEVLAKICRAIELLGFEFMHGSQTVAIAFHGKDAVSDAAVVVDPTMPGFVRRLYPRAFDQNDLVRDLEACGVLINEPQRFLDVCATHNAPWKASAAYLFANGKEYGLEYSWDEDFENERGVRYVLRGYEFGKQVVDALISNIKVVK